jgi:hypothetical protein
MPVHTPRKDFEAFCAKWCRLRDTYNGRDAVLDAGEKYLPSLPGASTGGNKAYRERGNFYNAVRRTVGGMVGMLFQKEMGIKVPERSRELLADITLGNVSMEMFAFTATNETLLMGRYGLLIDMTNIQGQTVQRPYFVGYQAEQIINWSVEQIGGVQVVTRVVLKESFEETDPKDEFVRVIGEQYRVLQMIDGKYTQQLWRKPETANEFSRHQGVVTPLRRGVALGFIPFIFMGPLHVTSELEYPPLLDLADVNLAHWRNQVDYEYGLHLVALPTPWVAGVKSSGQSAAESTEPMKIGPSVVWELDVNGKAGMLEFQGTGMKAILEAMEEKKKQMASLGARLMEQEPRVQETAQAVSLRHSGDHATLKTLATAMGQALTLALQTMIWWTGSEDTPTKVTDVGIELNKEYLNTKATPQEVQAALQAVQAGKMSFLTFWAFIQAGGWGRDGVTAEEEQKQIQTEEPIVEPTVPEPVA